MKNNKKPKTENENEISRKDALKKIGLTSLSAATMMLLLNSPAKGQDTGDSPENPPEW